MKKLLLFMLLPYGLYAQEYKGFEGRSIIVKAQRVISSSDDITNSILPLFSVKKTEDKSLRGCEVYAKMIECKKSNMSGAEGRVVIRPLYILKDGKKIAVRGDILINGINRTNLKRALFFIPFMWFVPGGGAKTSDIYNEFEIFLE